MPQKMTNQEKSSDAYQLERGPLEKAANKKESGKEHSGAL